MRNHTEDTRVSAPVMSDEAIEDVAFPIFGYHVRIPKGWQYRKINPGAAPDLVLSHKPTQTQVGVVPYWDGTKKEADLDDVIAFQRARVATIGGRITTQFYDANATGYFIEFFGEQAVSGDSSVFRVVSIRLNRFPEPVFVIAGVTPRANEEFMWAAVNEIIEGIQPYLATDKGE